MAVSVLPSSSTVTGTVSVSSITSSALPTGASTEAKQDNQITLETSIDGKIIKSDTDNIKMADRANALTTYNVDLTVINTEYSQALPASTRAIDIKNRNLNQIRFAFETGKVATPTAPYNTLEGGERIELSDLSLTSKTIYVAGTVAADVVEIIARHYV